MLTILAAAFLAATFLDGVHLLQLPFAENPANVLGTLLALVFISTRIPGGRLWAGPGRFFWVFIVVTAVLEVGRLFADSQGVGVSSLRSYAQYAQTFLLYLIFFDLCRSARTVKMLAITFVVSTILMSLIANLGLGGLVGASALSRSSELERVGVLGMNLNQQGFLYAAAVTGVTCWSIARWPRPGVWGWALMAGAASMVLALLRTGSRGGLLVLVAGLAVALMLTFRSRRWSAYILLVPVALYGIGHAVMSSELIQTRLEQAMYQGRLGARDVLAREGGIMFLERPVTGWGCVAYTEELGERVGRDRIASHNTYLQIALSFGFMGFLPWLLGVGATVNRLWKYRTHFWGTLMLAVLIALLVAAVPGNFGYNKYFWMILAVAGAMPLDPPTTGGRLGSRVRGALKQPASLANQASSQHGRCL